MITNRLVILVCCLLTTTAAFSEEDEQKNDLFLSTPEQIATLNSEPDHLIGGLISPLSGQPVLRQTDLIAKGAQNIVLSRSYIPPYIPCSFPRYKHHQDVYDKKQLYNHLEKNYKGWQFYPHLKLLLNTSNMGVRLSDPNGTTLDFYLTGPNRQTILGSSQYAMSNAVGDIPSGQYDHRNTRIFLEENGNRVAVHAPDGTIRSYVQKMRIGVTTYLCFLQKEILPNGKVLQYHYTENNELACIESKDPKERVSYASIHLSGNPWQGSCHFTSSSGATVAYTYERRPFQWKIKGKHKGRKFRERGRIDSPPLLTSVSSPFYRHESLSYCDKFLLNSYSGRSDIFTPQCGCFGNGIPHFKVHHLLLPVAQNNALHLVHEVAYQPPIAGQREGQTIVKNSDGTSLIYHFSKNLLTTKIQYFGQDGSLKKENIFSWDDNNWLRATEMRDSQNQLLYRKSYEFDSFGNPILEIFTGDLKGDGIQENFVTKRSFSADGRNLLIQEEREDGKITCFSYLPNTHLVTSKLTKDRDQIILREFNVWDDYYNHDQKILDDGTTEDKDNLLGVSQRTWTTYTVKQSPPFLHMPEWVEESYWEKGIEKPLKKSHLNYDQHGNVSQEDVYDAEGKFCYSIHKTYNECGDLLSETNRLGQHATYTYDARGRAETSTNFSGRIHKSFYHDLKGRLKEQTTKGDDGIVHTTSSEYDFHDRRIQKTDSFQNPTQYTYNPLVNQIVRTELPPITSYDGHVIPVITLSTYDSFGRKLTQTDPNGNITTYSYNAYGSPTEILYADGSRESFRYEKNGELASHIETDGLAIHYQRDVLGRILSKTYVSTNGETLAEETVTYNGFNILAETDKEGHVRHYHYDGAGRKIREEFCSQITEFAYDSLGRLCTLCKHNGDNTLLIHYKRDLEGQIIEEHQTDLSGRCLHKVNYSYDADGNRATITKFIHEQEATDTFVYDSLNRLIEKTDAEGYATRTTYDENYTNSIGQRALQTTTIDPRGIANVQTQDASARTVQKQLLNPQNAILSSQEMTYDPQGNLLFQSNHVYENEQFKKSQILQYTYTPKNQISTLTRAFGTQDARTTIYTYFPSGKIATKTLPDHVTLSHTYDPLRSLSSLTSSDGQIHHRFTHNRLGHLHLAIDENQNILIQRETDPLGNVIQETFPNNFEITKAYDNFNRLISFNLPSVGEVHYIYDPLFLRNVIRTSSQGDVLYSHSYDKYDESGNLVTESLLNNLGKATHLTNLRGSKAAISSPYFSQKCIYDSVNNLIHTTTDGIELRYSYDGLSQLSSDNGLSYVHDSLYNRTQENAQNREFNDLNELISFENGSCSYDLNGNQILKKTPLESSHFTYDPLGRLNEVTSSQQKVNFTYDPLGRRLSKVTSTPTSQGWQETSREYYLYHGQNEIGAFTSSSHPKNLRVLGLVKQNCPATIAIELGNQVFAPLLDIQGNIRRLVDLKTKAITHTHDFTAFGAETTSHSTSPNPWRFASKRIDPEIGLIFFGKRYYDPQLGRWLTTDPAGFVDSVNLYQYVFNNPYRYKDPDGNFIIAIPLLALSWKVIAVAAVTAYVSYELERQHRHSNSEHSRNFNSAMHQVVQNIGGISQYMLNQELDTGKKKQLDARLPNDPDELLNNPKWEETSHIDAKEKGHRTFENKDTGEKLRFDQGKPGELGHERESHWHRYNPNSTNRRDQYLDANDNPVPRHSEDSHLYPN